MAKRCCGNCVYATQAEGHWHRVMMRRFPGLRLCFNSVENPGRMHEVRVDGCCENFRAQRWPLGERLRPPKPRDEDVRYIPLTRGYYAIVDAEDYEKLSKYKWYAQIKKNTDIIYACRASYYSENGKRCRRTIMMHREIMNPPDGMVVDHINSNGLNNRRCNLRACTHAQNLRAARPRPGTQSPFIGVTRRGDRWRARIRYLGEDCYLGTFDDPVEAARARDRRAIELFGEFARLNFPELRDAS